MSETRALVNGVIVFFQISIIIVYALDMTIPYPAFVINAFDRPLIRIIIYIALFAIAYYNPVISLLSLICVVTLHLDIINILESKKHTH